MSSRSGLTVAISPGPPEGRAVSAMEIDIGSALPVAFSGMRALIRALEQAAPSTVAAARAAGAPEWNRLFPESPVVGGRDLLELADAPNQRRLFRESEQTYRVLNFCARLIVDSLRALDRPCTLRSAGACDLVSMRGLMHAVELSRLAGIDGGLHLCDWDASHLHASERFAATRAVHFERIRQRMRATGAGARPATLRPANPAVADTTGEAVYLTRLLDQGGSREERLVAALLAMRACFFSTNHEGATLAAEVSLRLLSTPWHDLDQAALLKAWDVQDDPQFDIPMLELDRSSLGDLPHLRSQFHLHLAVVCVFTGRIDEGLDSIAEALEGGRLSPGTTADLRMYRAVALTKRMGRIGEARQEIEAGLAALAGSPRSTAALHEGWLRNLYALTYFQEKNLDQARHQEELALACIDGVPGPSATHLKTNLVSNFSVLAEAGGDIPTAIRVWRMFESLNRRLGSDSADKVHAYRLGTLQFLNGDAAAAIASFETAFQKADASGDAFNGETIAAALGRLHLARGGRGDTESSELWYRRAAARALVAGDCLHLARDRVGLTLASAGRDFASARESLACNSTYQLEGLRLPRAVAADDPAAMLEALPLPKSKMARPFDLVNV